MGTTWGLPRWQHSVPLASGCCAFFGHQFSLLGLFYQSSSPPSCGHGNMSMSPPVGHILDHWLHPGELLGDRVCAVWCGAQKALVGEHAEEHILRGSGHIQPAHARHAGRLALCQSFDALIASAAYANSLQFFLPKNRFLPNLAPLCVEPGAQCALQCDKCHGSDGVAGAGPPRRYTAVVPKWCSRRHTLHLRGDCVDAQHMACA